MTIERIDIPVFEIAPLVKKTGSRLQGKLITFYSQLLCHIVCLSVCLYKNVENKILYNLLVTKPIEASRCS